MSCARRSGASGLGETWQCFATGRRSQKRERPQKGRKGHAGPGHQGPSEASETETCTGKVGL